MDQTPAEKRIGELALKRLRGRLTADEARELSNWLSGDDGRALEIPAALASNEQDLEQKIWQGIRSHTLPRSRVFAIRLRWVAAAAVLALVLSAAWWYADRPGMVERAQTAALKLQTGSAGYIQNLQLPDGSMVVLQARSSLEYMEESGTRRVVLRGEAFFDIAHDPDHPFVIHTGNVRTTVLGTSFNIRAYPGQSEIIVSVTRGKVKVEDEDHLLAELETDEQIRYSPQGRETRLVKEVVAAESVVTDWTRQDMVFEDVPLARAAETLERRYGVRIRFVDPAVGACLVRASFTGTEPVDKVIKILCNVLGDEYTVIGPDTYLIDGDPCEAGEL